jgi:hypothetical protein
MFKDTILYKRLQAISRIEESTAWMWTFLTDRNLKADIISLIQKNQLEDKGVDEDGEVIGYYSYFTMKNYNQEKIYGEHFTLNDSGEFFKSIYITVLKDSFVVNADYAKMQDQEWWSENILGLTDESIEVVKTRIKEGFINYLLQLD